MKKHVTKQLQLVYQEHHEIISPKKVNISFVEKANPNQELEAYERIRKLDSVTVSELLLHGGPVWQNNNFTCVNYYDSRNTIGVFNQVIHNKSITIPSHNQSDDNDINNYDSTLSTTLDIGNSLGAGSMAILTNDTIFTIAESSKSNYKLIENGRTKAAFELYYKNWINGSNSYNINHQISISNDANYYESTIIATGVREGDKFVTGILAYPKDSLITIINTDGYTIIANQITTKNLNELNHENHLSLGILIDHDSFDQLLPDDTPTNGIEHTHMIALNLSNNKPLKYRVYIGWQSTNDNFKNIDYLVNMMKKDASCLKNPIQIKVLD